MLRRVGVVAADLLLAAVGILGVVISVRSLISPPDSIKGLGVAVSFLLAAVGLLLITAVVERRLRLDALRRQLDHVEASLRSDAVYLPDSGSVRQALTTAVNLAEEGIFALGARSHDKEYLAAIEDAVDRRRLPYYRVIDGDEISHRLHIHLIRVRENASENVFVAWTRSEKYGNLTATEKVCVIAIPSPFSGRLAGLLLSGTGVSARYSQQVLAVYAAPESRLVSEADLEDLCIECRIR